MEEKVFISPGIEKCYTEYFAKNTTSFYSFIIDTLCKIFAKLDIENSYKLKMEYNACGFRYILKRYGAEDKDINDFINHVDNYVKFQEKNCQIIEKKNPYLVSIVKDLIDFYFQKCYKLNLDIEEINRFYESLYCMNSSSSYKRSYVFLKCEYPEEIDRYFKRKVYEYKHHFTFLPVKENVLDMNVYAKFGLTKEQIELLNQKTLDEINDKVFEYLHIDPQSEDRSFLASKFIDDMDLSKFKLNETSGQINVKSFLVIFGSIILMGIIIGILFMR